MNNKTTYKLIPLLSQNGLTTNRYLLDQRRFTKLGTIIKNSAFFREFQLVIKKNFNKH